MEKCRDMRFTTTKPLAELWGMNAVYFMISTRNRIKPPPSAYRFLAKPLETQHLNLIVIVTSSSNVNQAIGRSDANLHFSTLFEASLGQSIPFEVSQGLCYKSRPLETHRVEDENSTRLDSTRLLCLTLSWLRERFPMQKLTVAWNKWEMDNHEVHG
ncbi:predicted protein [Plenodomus lingam JN3]|uniref:Predicted protein n=1 Tax=Leptosphaeria maculans (strain JN3 / isolate v23.1.3 / race Av1-4-5-6-7-8) TaxID=985895 RepID=E4ZPL0_LEPMJ|nr:predicted protein [Plenodomus lingam JN3]CBX93235.1 predicted protein [Plenodomus lingam JN3]